MLRHRCHGEYAPQQKKKKKKKLRFINKWIVSFFIIIISPLARRHRAWWGFLFLRRHCTGTKETCEFTIHNSHAYASFALWLKCPATWLGFLHVEALECTWHRFGTCGQPHNMLNYQTTKVHLQLPTLSRMPTRHSCEDEYDLIASNEMSGKILMNRPSCQMNMEWGVCNHYH